MGGGLDADDDAEDATTGSCSSGGGVGGIRNSASVLERNIVSPRRRAYLYMAGLSVTVVPESVCNSYGQGRGGEQQLFFVSRNHVPCTNLQESWKVCAGRHGAGRRSCFMLPEPKPGVTNLGIEKSSFQPNGEKCFIESPIGLPLDGRKGGKEKKGKKGKERKERKRIKGVDIIMRLTK